MKVKVIVGTIFGLIAVGLGLAADYGFIAIDEYRYKSPIITFLYAMVNLPVIVVMAITGAGFSQIISSVLFFIWWFIVGFILCFAFERIGKRVKRRGAQ